MLIVSSTVGSRDHHGLETALERRILLDVLPILVERGGANRMQLAASQHGLEHVGGVHRALRGAGADHGVELVDEEDHLTLRVDDLLQYRFEPLLELAAILRAGHQGAHVERDNALALQAFGHVAAENAAGEAFDDGGLADTGLADEHRVVLRSARQHLDHAPDFLVAADHRIELAFAGELGEVAAVPLERLVCALGVLARHALRTADADHRCEDLVACQAAFGEQPGGGGASRLGRDGDEQVLGADVLVLQPLCFGFGEIGDQLEPGREARLRAAVRLGNLAEQVASGP